MICPACQREGKQSRIKLLGYIVTSMCAHEFYDEQGRYHSHDPNSMSTSARCSAGHQLAIVVKHGCDVDGCDFGVYSREVREVAARKQHAS